MLQCAMPHTYYTLCTVWLVSCLFLTLQLITILVKTLTFFYQSTFTGFLEVFVPWIILYKSNRNNLFVIVFPCSRAFQWYQTWNGNNYLNMINYQVGQKKDKVLVSLHLATSRDVAIQNLGQNLGHADRHTHRHTHTQTHRQTYTQRCL